jgi:recombination protein RecT
MDKLKPQMTLALPKHLTADRMARLALTAFSTSPKLQQCTHQSIAASIMTAVQLGLEPNVNGACYLIPYGTTCTFVPGWKGLVDLVNRSGRGTVYTGVIYDDQIQGVDWEFVDGSRRELLIKKQSSLFDEKNITHTFAIGWVKDAQMPIIELWSSAKLIAHRNKYNKVGTKHYSFRDWEMYARKIPLLQVLKYMPCSVEMSMAIEVANVSEFGGVANIDGGIVVSTQYQDEQPETVATPTPTEPIDKFTEAFSLCADLEALNEKTKELTASASALTKPKINAAYNSRLKELEKELGV